MDEKRFQIVDDDEAARLFPGDTDLGGCNNYRLVEFASDGKALRIVGSDGGEPEDQLLVRDWEWVCHEMNALSESHAREVAELRAELDLIRAQRDVAIDAHCYSTYEAHFFAFADIWPTIGYAATAQRIALLLAEGIRHHDNLEAGLEAERAAHAATKARLAEAENKLRMEWWHNHGCLPVAMYGDDGEMQCGSCLTDFKHTEMDTLGERVEMVRAARLRYGGTT